MRKHSIPILSLFVYFFLLLGPVLGSQREKPSEGMKFLLAHMPEADHKELTPAFLTENVELAYQVMDEVPWGKDIPHDIFLNDILPYASINERRDNWRRDFHDRFIKIAQESGTIERAVKALNTLVFKEFQVTYNPDKRPKPDQSPYESIEAHYASCTGLSVLLVDALRSVGIPARIAGIALWADESGNHTWVEVWDGQWHAIGAAEPTELDQGWFQKKASQTDHKHRIYATSFKKTNLFFPMAWAPDLKTVFAIDGTERYTQDTKMVIKEHLVKIQDVDPTIILDLRYATADNFTKKKIYPSSKGIVRYETAQKLTAANQEFKKDGYTIKVWDAYRPIYVQKIFWNLFPDDRYVANPYKGGSRHNRGGAVDITLVDQEGKEVEMPTGFDDFSSKAWPNNFTLGTKASQNVRYLRRIMMKHGFTPLEHEWWHFDDKNWRDFPLVDVSLDGF